MENKKEQEKIVMYDSPEAATYRTNLSGWVSRNGFYFGDLPDSEDRARYHGCTHRKCSTEGCENIVSIRGYTICGDCRNKKDQERYDALPFKEYDGSPVCTRDGEHYFFSEDEILDYLYDLEEEDVPERLELVFCVENHYRPICSDQWEDRAVEDWDGSLPKEMQEALDNLNKVIEEMPPQSYSAGTIRTYYISPKNK